MLRRSRSSGANAGKWDLPGGKPNFGEDINEALLREVAEETGLKVSLQHVAGVAETELPAKKIAYLFIEGYAQSCSVTLSSEHDRYTWVECGMLPGMDVPEQFRAFIAQYVQKCGHDDSERKKD